jgi:hypothetical protein
LIYLVVQLVYLQRCEMISERFAIWLLAATVVLTAQAQFSRAADEVSLPFRNDSSTPVDLFIASEKSQSNEPWTHRHFDPGEDTTFKLNAPDRYVVVLQIGDYRSKSKPLDLKKFVVEHPAYVMRVSEVRTATLGAQPGGSGTDDRVDISVGVGRDPKAPEPSSDATNAAPAAYMPIGFEGYDRDDQSIWSLSPDSVALKMHNDLPDPVDFYIAAQKNQNPNPWTHFRIAPNDDSTTILKSPDPFIIRIDVGNESARSKPIELKAFLADHRSYVMNLGRNYEEMIAGVPQGGGGQTKDAAPKLRATVILDPKKQPASVPTPPIILGPTDPSATPAFTPPKTLNIEWE